MADTDQSRPTGTQALIDAIERLAGAQEAQVQGAEYVILPKGKELRSLKPIIDQFRKQPERRVGITELETLDALVAHIQRFKDSDTTAIFAHSDPSKTDAQIVAVYDYHPTNADISDARFGDHRALYRFPFSKEWGAWATQDGKAMAATQFSEFLEDRIQDVVSSDPPSDALAKLAQLVQGRFATPSDLIELARNLEITVSGSVRSVHTTASGEISLAVTEEHSAQSGGQTIKVPNLFVLGIPVFRSGVLYRIPCRLRYRLTGGQVTWWYNRIRPEDYIEDAFKESCDKVKADTSMPLFRGTPETRSSQAANTPS